MRQILITASVSRMSQPIPFTTINKQYKNKHSQQLTDSGALYKRHFSSIIKRLARLEISRSKHRNTHDSISYKFCSVQTRMYMHWNVRMSLANPRLESIFLDERFSARLENQLRFVSLMAFTTRRLSKVVFRLVIFGML